MNIAAFVSQHNMSLMVGITLSKVNLFSIVNLSLYLDWNNDTKWYGNALGHNTTMSFS